MLKAKQTYFCPSSVYYFPRGTFWFQIGKGVCQGCILSPCLLNLYAEHIMRNTGLEEAQAWTIKKTEQQRIDAFEL